jgi:hypothetical protein
MCNLSGLNSKGIRLMSPDILTSAIFLSALPSAFVRCLLNARIFEMQAEGVVQSFDNLSHHVACQRDLRGHAQEGETAHCAQRGREQRSFCSIGRCA